MNNLDKDFQRILTKIINKGRKKGDRTGTGTISIFGEEIKHDMNEGFPLITTKKVFHRGTFEEVIWFMKGKTDLRSLVSVGVNIWVGDAYKKYKNTVQSCGNVPYIESEFIEKIKTDDQFNKEWGNLGRIYGAQWRNWLGFDDGYKKASDLHLHNLIYDKSTCGTDQLLNLIHDLKSNPDSRRLIVNAWQPSELNEMTLPPCHYGFQCYTRELDLEERVNIYFERHKDWTVVQTHKFLDTHKIPKRGLSLKWNQRSVDTALGLPFNIASYGALLLILAKITNMFPEDLIGSLGDTHIYLNQLDGVKEQLSRPNIFKLPNLKLIGEFDNVENYWTEDGFELDNFLSKICASDLQLIDYESHPKIYFPLSN